MWKVTQLRLDVAFVSIKYSDCAYEGIKALKIHPGDLSELAASLIAMAN